MNTSGQEELCDGSSYRARLVYDTSSSRPWLELCYDLLAYPGSAAAQSSPDPRSSCLQRQLHRSSKEPFELGLPIAMG